LSKGSHFFQQTLSLVNVCGISIIFQTKKKNNFGNETTFATSFQKSFQKNFFGCKKIYIFGLPTRHHISLAKWCHHSVCQNVQTPKTLFMP
jgi:hypothetical protein